MSDKRRFSERYPATAWLLKFLAGASATGFVLGVYGAHMRATGFDEGVEAAAQFIEKMIDAN